MEYIMSWTLKEHFFLIKIKKNSGYQVTYIVSRLWFFEIFPSSNEEKKRKKTIIIASNVCKMYTVRVNTRPREDGLSKDVILVLFYK